MAHIATGIVFLLTALLLLLIDRFYPYVDFMSGFTEKDFKRLVGGFSLVGVLLFGFGVYSYVTTYTPPFIQIQEGGEGYFVDGAIENIGYIQSEMQIYRAGEETSMILVSWEDRNAKELTVHLKDEAGKEYDFPHELQSIDNEFSTFVHEKLESTNLFELSPFVFETEGKWKITINENEKEIASFQTMVYE